VTHPSAEVIVDLDLVRQLLQSQCPALADKPLRYHDEGWDNFTYRLGEQYSVRLPRRQMAVPLVEHEQRWLPEIAARLPIAIPVPVFAGRPTDEYPWPWSVVRWVPGETPKAPLNRANALRLAEVLALLHQPAPQDAPQNPYRGVPLETRNEFFVERMQSVEAEQAFDTERMSSVWKEALIESPPRDRRWLHGDLHSQNVVLADGHLAGLIDWGDLAAGDVATDLAAAWMLIDAEEIRREFFDRYGADASTQTRARGWALHLGLAFFVIGEGRDREDGREIVRRVLNSR